MTESGCSNEDVFLEWLQHFQKHRTSGKCLLILDGHMSHCSLKALHYCRQHHIEMLCLPPHTTHALQPLDRTVYKPLNSYYHQEATAYMHNHPQASINKSNFERLFSAAWSKSATVGNAVKGFRCTGLYPYNPNAISDRKFLPSIHFTNDKEPESCRPTSATPEQSTMAQPTSSGPSSSKRPTTVYVQDHCLWDVPPGRHQLSAKSYQAQKNRPESAERNKDPPI
jgi:hypothetical protein